MIRLKYLAPVGATLVLGALLLSGCESDLEPLTMPKVQSVQATYVGAQKCGTCHQTEYEEFLTTGHGYKLNRVVGGSPPFYPFREEVPFPLLAVPTGYTWDDVLYVIGGYGWKARFIGLDGYIITGTDVQWNLETGEWVGYHAGEHKPYDCGSCHTTGYSPEGNQLGLEGLVGTWHEDGVTCEACHGPGSLHVVSQRPEDIAHDHRSELCGRCHTRDAQRRIAAGGPDGAGDQFIQHHEQYDEMIAAGHRYLTCVSCHDPHRSTRFEPEEAIVLDCETCHGEIEVYNTGDGAHSCVGCHMPFATKSAVKRSAHEGDIKTHIFKIDPSATADMFYQEDGSWFAHGFVTADFACLRCHSDRDRQWAEDHADGIHSDDKRLLVGG